MLSRHQRIIELQKRSVGPWLLQSTFARTPGPLSTLRYRCEEIAVDETGTGEKTVDETRVDYRGRHW